jgi:GNAT superfamily N-acetyltransferase
VAAAAKRRAVRTAAALAPRPRTASSARTRWRCEPLTAERWRDFTALFGARGACAGCWCTWARLTHAEFKSTPATARRAHIRRVVQSGEPPGLLAYDGDTPVGWIALAPRAAFRRLASSRVLAPVDAADVWSVPCFFVARTHRGRGLTTALLRAACVHAAGRGARILEGYPVDTRGKAQAAAFVYPGLPSAFAAAGFREVARRSPTRPIVRRALRAPRRNARG